MALLPYVGGRSSVSPPSPSVRHPVIKWPVSGFPCGFASSVWVYTLTDMAIESGAGLGHVVCVVAESYSCSQRLSTSLQVLSC